MGHYRIWKLPVVLLIVFAVISVSAPAVFAVQSGDFTYEPADGGVVITGYSGNAASVSVPERLGNQPVVSIGDNAFSGKASIIEVSLPRGVKKIGHSAFSGCSKLQSVHLPYTLTSIGDYAFLNCSALQRIIFPDSLTSIGYDAFGGCNTLISIEAASTNPAFFTAAGVLYDKDGDTLLCCPAGKQGVITVPEGVTAIGDEAFTGCSGITAISLPQTLASIGCWAFSGCKGLTGLTLPDKLETIGASAFDACAGLVSVTIPRGVISAGINAFDGCTALANILVDDGNMTYSSRGGVLYDKSGIELIRCPEGRFGAFEIPRTVSIVADWAFSGCARLTTIFVPETVFSIGKGAFVCGPAWAMAGGEPVPGAAASSLTSIHVDDFNSCYSSRDGVLYNDMESEIITVPAGRSGTFSIPGSVMSIGDYSFACCTALTDISIPSTVSSIGREAFECCTNLSSVTIPASVTSIGDEAFIRCANLSRPMMENALTRLGKNVFSDMPESFKVYYHASLSEQWADFAAYPKQAYCLVSIDLLDGSPLSQASADVTDGKLKPPVDPKRAGYAFDGWYKEAECKTVFDFNKELVQSDIRLYAKWVIAAPGTLKAYSASYKSVTLTWSAVEGAAGYDIYRSSTASGTYTLIKSLTSTSYTNTGLSAGKTYYYKICTYRLNGTAKECGAYTAVVSARPGIAAPHLIVSASADSVKLTWAAVFGATGYEVWRCEKSAAGSYSLIANPSIAGYSENGLTAGKKYWYKVRAYRVVNNKKVYGAYSAAISVQQ